MEQYTFSQHIVYAAKYIQQFLKENDLRNPDVAVVLGTGLHAFAEECQKEDSKCQKKELSYHLIPGMPRTTVQGHAGKIVFLNLGGKQVYCFSGRKHMYENTTLFEITFFARLMAYMGCKLFIITAATGGLKQDMKIGDFCLLTDTLRLIAREDPMKGLVQEPLGRDQFFGKQLWSENFRKVAREVAKEIDDLTLHEGSYCYATGPNYETPLEIIISQKLGASTVGMSTVPECIVAATYGMEVGGIASISDVESELGVPKYPLTHEEVLKACIEASGRFIKLLKGIILKIELNEKKPFVGQEIKKNYAKLPRGKFLEQYIHKACEILNVKEDIHLGIALYDIKFDVKKWLGSNYTEISFDKLPHFPVQSFSAKKGKLYIGKYKDKIGTIILSAGDMSGFYTHESVYLSLLLKQLGVKQVLTTMQGIKTREINFSSPLVVLEDCFDLTEHHLPLETISKYTYQSELDSSKREKLLAKFNEKFTYMALPGPFPSKAEVETANIFGAELAGVSSLVLVRHLQYIGIPVFTTAVTLHEKAPIEEPLAQIYEEMFALETKSEKSPARFKFVYPKYPARNVNYDNVMKVVGFFKDKFPTIPDVCILDFKVGYQDRDKLICVTSLNSVPNVTSTGFISLFSVNNHSFFYINVQAHNEDDMTLILRGYKQLGGKTVIMTSYVRDMTKPDTMVNLQKKGLCIVKDHANFTGTNPMMGVYEARWGVMFFDVSKAYTKSLREEMVKVANTFDSSHIDEVNCLCGDLSVFHSHKEQEMAAKMNMQVQGMDFMGSVIVGTHVGFDILVIGVVENIEKQKKVKAIETLGKMLNKFLSGGHIVTTTETITTIVTKVVSKIATAQDVSTQAKTTTETKTVTTTKTTFTN